MLDGHVALITGAAGGIGLAAAKKLHGDGAKVMLADIDRVRLGDAATAIGEGAAATVLDVTSRDSWKAALAFLSTQRAFPSLRTWKRSAMMPGTGTSRSTCRASSMACRRRRPR
jgi:NAD(P)-dependent dehydrogenase (short-subunit alcohol dehydrogenase family)